ncbi:MAG: helix-turn-helix domain-containing protein [Thermoplasmataceae archaeon]
MKTVTIKEAAALLAVHPETVRRWIARGAVLAKLYGRTWRLPIGNDGLPIERRAK